MMTRRPSIDVLVFDSGLGGLTVFAEMRRRLPGLRACYVADNAGLPYGNKTDEWLEARVSHVITAALRQVHPRLIVIACNTASTLVLPTLRAQHAMPIVGVVPAIKPAAQQTQVGVIGLLATAATIQRPYTQTLIEQFAPACQVLRIGSSELVEMAERKLRGEALEPVKLATILAPFREASPMPDIIVLGCTHFPLLHHELEAALPGIRLLDSGPAIARRIEQVLPLTPHSEYRLTSDLALITASEQISVLTPIFANWGFASTQILSLTMDSSGSSPLLPGK